MSGSNFEVIVRAIIRNSQGHTLLVKRAKPPHQFYWSLPGGKVEFSETCEAAIIREIAEELGVTFNPKTHFIHDDLKSFPGLHCVVIYWTGQASGTLKCKTDEALAARYFSNSSLKQSQSIAFDHKEVLLHL